MSSVDSFFGYCHDVYELECTDEYDSYGFMVGNTKYTLMDFSYPVVMTQIIDSDNLTIFSGDIKNIESAKLNKDGTLDLIIKSHTITLGTSTGSEP